MTMSICEVCYRHIPAEVFERDGSVWIKKECIHHGKTEYMIERSAEFYNSLVCDRNAYDPSGYVLEVTDRCNLKCPHCYQEPDNKKVDKGIDYILHQVASFPDDGMSLTLAGAEPTMRKDIVELIQALKKTGRAVNVLTNGVKLSSKELVQQLISAGCDFVTIGLNHPDYQGMKVHKQQLKGIKNCVELGLRIKNINYTLENLEQVPYIVKQIQEFGNTAEEYRIRGGSDIGRCPDQDRLFLSDIVSHVHSVSNELNLVWEKIPADDNIYHYMVKLNGIVHRIIQWADAKSVDLDELLCGPWGTYIPGVPTTNLMHQIILRDAVVNKHMNLWDKVPSKYAR